MNIGIGRIPLELTRHFPPDMLNILDEEEIKYLVGGGMDERQYSVVSIIACNLSIPLIFTVVFEFAFLV